MAKLNESKKSERFLKTSLEELGQKCDTWQEKAEEADKVVKGSQALQNTIDHLENRLEIANIERLDAEEQLFNLQTQKSPFDFKLQDLRVPSPLNHDHAKVGYIIPRQINGLKRWETLQANEYVSLHNKS
jgi:chromosome segregation ATPase